MNKSIALTSVVYSVLTLSIPQPAFSQTIDRWISQENPRYDQSNKPDSFTTELSNIRALPFGYRAVCEQLTLKIRSSTSATFIIRNSILCRLSASSRPVVERDSFMLCSNDPHQSNITGSRVVPKCAELVITLQEI